ncbi:MAG: DMT family transporter [Candidatus Roizmanbacteria bacterium]
MTWITFAFIALFSFGIQKFLFKVSAERNYSSKRITLYFMATVTCIALIVQLIFFRSDSMVHLLVVFGAGINGIAFLLLSLTRLKALKLAPSLVVMPLFELSNILMLPLSILLFHDSISGIQYIGIILGTFAGLLLLKKQDAEHSKYPHFIIGVLFACGAMVCALFLGLTSKYIAISDVNKVTFILISYGINTLILLIQTGSSYVRKKETICINYEEIRLGIGIGIFNFIAFFSHIYALQTQSIPVVGVIVSCSTVVALGLSIYFYKEKLTVQRILGIIMAFIAVLLLK